MSSGCSSSLTLLAGVTVFIDRDAALIYTWSSKTTHQQQILTPYCHDFEACTVSGPWAINFGCDIRLLFRSGFFKVLCGCTVGQRGKALARAHQIKLVTLSFDASLPMKSSLKYSHIENIKHFFSHNRTFNQVIYILLNASYANC